MRAPAGAARRRAPRVNPVGSGRGRTLTKDRQKTKLMDYPAAEKAAATPPYRWGLVGE